MRVKGGAKVLTIKAEAIRKGLNASVRALLEAATDTATDTAELSALCYYVGREIPTTAEALRAAIADIKPAEVVTAYRNNSAYQITTAEGRRVVAKATRHTSGAEVYTFEASNSFNISALFRIPFARLLAGRKPFEAEAEKVYTKAKGGFIEISKAEAARLIKAAEDKAAAEALARAKAEAQAEADRKAGEALRVAKAKAATATTKATAAAA